MIPKHKPSISIQWHITTNCNNKCRHCYMFDEKTFSEEREKTLSGSDLLKTLDSILEFEKKWDFSVSSFSVSGGDPLLRNDWFEFFSAIRSHGKVLSVMGNPESLSAENIKRLKELKLRKFQFSLDGLEDMHDNFRQPGSFRRTVEKIKELEENGIPTQVMFTLYPENRNDLFPLIEYLAHETPLRFFHFDIGTSAGNAGSLSKDFTADEIKQILERYVSEKRKIMREGLKLALGEKSHLFSLLHHEEIIRFNRNNNNFAVTGGCLAGWFSLCILSDGSVLGCRRLPVKAGKMPEQSFEEIFLGSELLKKFRRRSVFSECGNCALYKECRGCPAYVHGVKGEAFTSHPLCFKDSSLDDKNINNRFPEPGLNTGFEEEYQFWSSAFHYNQNYLVQRLMQDRELRSLYLKLIDDPDAINEFLDDKAFYVNKNNIAISEYDLALMQYYFYKLLQDEVLNIERSRTVLKSFTDKLKLIQLSQ